MRNPLNKPLDHLLHAYNQWRALTWAVGLLATIGAPLLAWLKTAISVARQRRQAAADDDPELAEDMTVPSPVDWASGLGGAWGRVVPWLMLIGGLLLLAGGIMLTVRGIRGSRSRQEAGDGGQAAAGDDDGGAPAPGDDANRRGDSPRQGEDDYGPEL